jgi:hypothetical protein
VRRVGHYLDVDGAARRPVRVAWWVWAAAAVLFVASVVLLIAVVPEYGINGALDPHLLLIPGYASVGAVIASRRPGNRIGWLFLALGLVSATETVAFLYALLALDRSTGLPFGVGAAWFSNWQWSLSWVLLIFLLLLFPDGRLPSRRWRPVALAIAIFGVLFVLGAMLDAQPLEIAISRWTTPLESFRRTARSPESQPWCSSSGPWSAWQGSSPPAWRPRSGDARRRATSASSFDGSRGRSSSSCWRRSSPSR